MIAALRQLLASDRGGAAVEFAIIGNVLVLLLVGGVDFGRTLWVKNELSFLADKAARRVLISPGISDTDLTTELREGFTAGDAATLSVNMTTATDGGTNYRVITVSYPITLFVPGLNSEALQLDVKRRIPAE